MKNKSFFALPAMLLTLMHFASVPAMGFEPSASDCPKHAPTVRSYYSLQEKLEETVERMKELKEQEQRIDEQIQQNESDLKVVDERIQKVQDESQIIYKGLKAAGVEWKDARWDHYKALQKKGEEAWDRRDEVESAGKKLKKAKRALEGKVVSNSRRQERLSAQMRNREREINSCLKPCPDTGSSIFKEPKKLAGYGALSLAGVVMFLDYISDGGSDSSDSEADAGGAGSSPTGGSTTDSTAKVTVSGTVRCSCHSQGLSGIAIWVDNAVLATSGGGGSYSFQIEPGTHTIATMENGAEYGTTLTRSITSSTSINIVRQSK